MASACDEPQTMTPPTSFVARIPSEASKSPTALRKPSLHTLMEDSEAARMDQATPLNKPITEGLPNSLRLCQLIPFPLMP